MSSSENTSQVRVELRAEDPATEIFLIDSQFQLAARSVGVLEQTVPAGIYKLKTRVGMQMREEPFILQPGAETVARTLAPIDFPSPAPLDDTSKSHEYHQYAAAQHSRETDVEAGSGSSIFLFARDWTGRTPKVVAARHPGRGLSLRHLNSRRVIADFAHRSVVSTDSDPWSACNVAINPGFYRLRLKLASGATLEQVLVAPPGWQLQVFTLQRDYSSRDRRADLAGASMMLSRGGFDPYRSPSERRTRLVETARLGLANRRPVLSDEVRSMLQDKFEDPMLGIYGGHLLMLEPEPDLRLLRIVVDNLRGLLGPHPDVEALALALGPNETSYVFEKPPMLRRSWELIVEATARQPWLVPNKSTAALISGRLLPETPWCIWVTSDADDEGELKKIITKMLADVGHTKSSQSVLEVVPGADARNLTGATALEPAEDVDKLLDDETARRLVQALGMPRATIESLIERT